MKPLGVLVVDDSAVVRQILHAILSSAGMRVTLAADARVAVERLKVARPEVIVLDLDMPRMDGLTFLRKLMAENPLPVVVCSAMTGPGTLAGARALEAGAMAVLAKPRVGNEVLLSETSTLLIEAVRGAAQAKLIAGGEPVRQTRKVVAMGASIGGTDALREILAAMPASAPAILVVQHMPEGFTAAYAKRVNALCKLYVKEAANGEIVQNGSVYIAPGNRHMAVRREGSRMRIALHAGPLVSGHRPSVDILFQSVAAAAGAEAVGVLLTGMGGDGAGGLLAMRGAGAWTMAQDQASCVVYGMPGEAVKRGAVCEIIALERIAAALLVRTGSPAISCSPPDLA